jgi:hypothetical protein
LTLPSGSAWPDRLVPSGAAANFSAASGIAVTAGAAIAVGEDAVGEDAGAPYVPP